MMDNWDVIEMLKIIAIGILIATAIIIMGLGIWAFAEVALILGEAM